MKNIKITCIVLILICSYFLDSFSYFSKSRVVEGLNNTLTTKNFQTFKNIDKNLLGTWISEFELLNGRLKEAKGTHKITFKKNGKFYSIYKPDNYKNGYWEVSNDSILKLYMKVIDEFKIVELTSNSLKVKALYYSPDTLIINYKKGLNH